MLNSKYSDSLRLLSIRLVWSRGQVRRNGLDAGCFQGPPHAWDMMELDRGDDKKIAEQEFVEREKLCEIGTQMLVISSRLGAL